MSDQFFVAPRWASFIATFGGIGQIKPAPGTSGSAGAVILWWLISRFIPVSFQSASLAALALTVVLAGIPAATRVIRTTGTKDPQFVVIDEVAGQWITLIAAPITWKCLLAGFILFRAFDIVKPPPIRALERLPEGIGVVVDDVGAGIYAWVVLRILLHWIR